MYAKPPWGGPEPVLKYLAWYVHRVAISNSRLVKVEDDQVHFTWKDYADGHAEKTMALPAFEFIRRFLQHVVPSGFVRIRHYGLLANRHREEKLQRCRHLLGVGRRAMMCRPRCRGRLSRRRLRLCQPGRCARRVGRAHDLGGGCTPSAASSPEARRRGCGAHRFGA